MKSLQDQESLENQRTCRTSEVLRKLRDATLPAGVGLDVLIRGQSAKIGVTN